MEFVLLKIFSKVNATGVSAWVTANDAHSNSAANMIDDACFMDTSFNQESSLTPVIVVETFRAS
jgi:hypothetical protein